MATEISESIKILLREIIDYAGLFPPAGLSMPEAVINYATYRNSNYSWILGRFIVPADRLDEFLESSRDFYSRDEKGVWRLSVLASEDIFDTVRKIEDFNSANAPGAIIDTLEVKADAPESVEKISEVVPDQINTYFEVPNDNNLPDLISAIAVQNKRAKIRTGGVTPEMFPNSGDVIRFIRTCLAANTPFKATAGLHHPIRCFSPLTYEANAPKSMMHGFLNLFMATGFARDGFKPSVLEEVLEEEFEEVFEFDDNGAYWQKEHFLNNQQIAKLRERGAVSFGSCSFDEPLTDLQRIGLL